MLTNNLRREEQPILITYALCGKAVCTLTTGIGIGQTLISTEPAISLSLNLTSGWFASHYTLYL